MSEYSGIEIKNYKLKALPVKPIPNAILYIKGDSDTEVSTYITDVNGVPHALKDDGSTINPGVQTVFNTDGTISVIGTENVKVSLQSGLVSLINSALQSGDIPNTKAEYNTSLTDGDFLFVGDVSNYTDEQAQDAVGNTLTDTTTIDFIYNDATPSISATVKPNSITSTELANNIDLTEFVNNAGFETTSQLNIRDTNNRNRANHTGTQAISTIVNLQTSLDAKENKSEKNVANGYAPLDSNGKVPLANTNDALLGNVKWYGLYDGVVISSSPVPSLNGQPLPTPALLNTGWYFIANAPFTYSLKNYEVGDWIISNGIIWDKVDNTDAVSSVFGRTGVVTAQNGDYTTALVPDTLNKRYVTDANLATIGNQSGVNTGDESTASIQTKRPIKTINTISLEGVGNAVVSTDSVPNASLVPGATTSDVLNILNNGIVYKRTIAQIRAFSGTLISNNFYTTDLGQEGNWRYDSTDITSVDNTGTILVTSDGKRIKRIFTQLNVKFFGAKGDEVTDDSSNVFNALTTSKSISIPLFFPKGTYYVSHIGAEDAFANSTIYSDKGVIISVLDSPNISTTVDALNPIKIKLRGLSSDIWLTPKNKENINEKSQSISTNDAKFQTNKLVDFTTLSYKRIDWPSSDTYVNYTPTSVSVTQANIAGINGTLTLALSPMEVGKSSSIQYLSGTGEIVLYIKTTTGTYGVFVGTGDSATPAAFSKQLGVTGTSSGFSYPGLGTHASYASFKSNITIRTMNKNTYSILYNGQVVQNNVKVTGEISDIGFGCTATGSFIITDWVDSYSDIDEGKSIVKLALFGDSRTDDSEYMNWADYTKKYLDGVAGVRVHEIYNYAVSGQAIAQQKLLCTPTNIADSAVVIIDIGTNDIQLNTNQDTFAADLATMIDVCLTAKKRVIIGLPDLFYTQGQAGARGQGAVNYDLQKGIRAKAMTTAANKGVYFIDKAQILGSILAQYVNPSLSDSYVPLGLDPIVYDNIHPTTYGRMILGREYGKAILAVIMEKTDKVSLFSDGTLNYIPKFNSSSSINNSHISTLKGDNVTPSYLDLDLTSNAGTAAFNKLKIYLLKTVSETYGFGLGGNADIQYWAGSSSNGMHRFFTSQIERLRIDSSGNIGIGVVNSGTSKIEVSGTVKASPAILGVELITLDQLNSAVSTAIANTVTSASTLTLTVTPALVNYYVFTGTTSTWTLPTPAGNATKKLALYNTGTGTITINTDSGANVIYNGGTPLVNTYASLPGLNIELYSDGTRWIVI